MYEDQTKEFEDIGAYSVYGARSRYFSKEN